MTRRHLTLTAPVALEVGRAAYGLVGLVAPARIAALELRRVPGRGTVTVARILGARHLAQAVAVLATRGPDAHRFGGGVDALHAASMVPWAAAARSERRYYVTSGVVAAALALLEWRASRQPV
ncbi:hypothetical protein [Terrabacter sp. C0L_2]|uniref:hypothetical protein n=1 Tax=Terrabacter sp. C0L_2 TaxID=3108389 RepID=UPI002ED585E0|nr:hypothetical protein U5C87_03140 [Terrabacter sp. C0L_2]